MSDKSYSTPTSGNSPDKLDKVRLIRDFDLYLDMLNSLKRKYMIILCLKNTTGQNIPEKTAEKIRSLGFSDFPAEPDMKYMGILNNGTVNCDESSNAYGYPLGLEEVVSKTKINILFDNKEAEISIGGEDQSLNDKGINIVVYDLKNQKAIDVSCYNAAENTPAFYHRNFFCDSKYIDSHIYMPERYKESVTLPMRRSYFSDRSLGVTELEKGFFLPLQHEFEFNEYVKIVEKYEAYGGVCDENFKLVAGHKLLNPRHIDLDGRHIWDSYRVMPEDITYIDETVLYGGSLIEHPGHLITECFADRLWWVVENPDSDIKIAVELLWSKSTLANKYQKSFVMEFLEAFGIPKERLIIIEKPTQFKKIIIPDQSAIPFNYCFPYEFTDGYIKPFQHITKQLTPGKYKKIYLTKSKMHRNNVIGEDYFIDFFEKKGFEIIDPEDYTVKEKAELMYGADEVVTLDGTNSLFSVFCKPSVRLTVLSRRMDYWDIPQQLINEALGIKEFFLVNVSGNFLENFSDDTFFNYCNGMVFVYATKEFKKYVKAVYNEDIDITPEDSFKKHVYEYLSSFPAYYSRPLYYKCIKNIKMRDVLRSMAEVFLDEQPDLSSHLFFTDNELRIKELEQQLCKEKGVSDEKIKLLTDKAKEFIDEISGLKQIMTQLQAENQQLNKEKAELTAYMAEISSLLDALEAGGGLPTE